MRILFVNELEGDDVTALRRHLADVPHSVRADLTIEESTRRILSMMVFVPEEVSEAIYSEPNRNHGGVADALSRFQCELGRAVPTYTAPLGLSCICATETKGTTVYSIEHVPGVVVQ